MKNPPSAYIQKLKSYLDTGGVSRKVRSPRCTLVPWSPSQAGHGDSANGVPIPQFKRRVQESTQVLRELEISLRTNYIG